MEGSVNGKVRAVLLVLALLWASAWLLADISNGNWLLAEVCCMLPFFVSATLSLIPILVAALVYIAARAFTRRFRATDCVPVVVVVAGLLVGWALPSKPGVMFWLHRGEFLELTEWAVEECDESWWHVYRSPASMFDWTNIDCHRGGPVVIEFFTGNFYLAQLVFISTDRPEDTPHCSYIGGVVERLQPQWYTCWLQWD
jgi:hypothetical protein